jgi:hypothetical protein
LRRMAASILAAVFTMVILPMRLSSCHGRGAGLPWCLEAFERQDAGRG